MQIFTRRKPYRHTGSKYRWMMPMWFGLGLLGAAAALAGCAGGRTPLLPASTNAQQVYNLIMVVAGLAAIVFVVVEGALIYAVARFRPKQPSGLPRQVEGNTRLEILWTVLPLIMLLILFVVSVQTLRAITTCVSAANPPISKICVQRYENQPFRTIKARLPVANCRATASIP